MSKKTKAWRRHNRRSTEIRKEQTSTMTVHNFIDKGRPGPTQHRLSFFKQAPVDFPELYLDVYLAVPPDEHKNFVEFFVKTKSFKADTPEEADIVVFGGGTDVNPIYYDESRHSTTCCSPQRDEADVKLYELCLDLGIPMFGVCRGAQFLHVMNGGKLYQDVDNHNGDHSIWDCDTRKLVRRVSSVHHQACIPNKSGGMHIVADVNNKSTSRWKNATEYQTGPNMDVEAFFYRDTCAFGVQGHPEYRGYDEFAIWTANKINNYLIENPDLALVQGTDSLNRGKYRRLKEDFIKQRNEGWKIKEQESNKGKELVIIN